MGERIDAILAFQGTRSHGDRLPAIVNGRWTSTRLQGSLSAMRCCPDLVKKFCPHIGQESFFELM